MHTWLEKNMQLQQREKQPQKQVRDTALTRLLVISSRVNRSLLLASMSNGETREGKRAEKQSKNSLIKWSGKRGLESYCSNIN